MRGVARSAKKNGAAFATLVVTLVLEAGGCVVVQPRLAAPLPDDGVTAGAFIAGTTKTVPTVPHAAVGAAGVSFAGQLARVDGFALELDGAIGGAQFTTGLRDGRIAGGSVGARAWHRWSSVAVGLDVNATGGIELDRNPSIAPVDTVRVEARVLFAAILAETVTAGARPGATCGLNGDPWPVLSLPVGVTWAPRDDLRLGVEVGVVGPWLLPVAAHAGMSAALVF